MTALPDIAQIIYGCPFPSDRFREGIDPNGLPVVRIRDVVPGRSNTTFVGDYDPVYLVEDGDIDELRQAAARVLSSASGEGGGRHVALILADVFISFPDAYGFMFDAPFPADGTPRMGCALFLNKIRAVRPDDQQFQEQVVYSAIHELGHVMNLWHVLDVESFMTKRTDDHIFTVREFVPKHKRFLSEAENPLYSSFILPGGTPYGERGPIGEPGADVPSIHRSMPRSSPSTSSFRSPSSGISSRSNSMCACD